MGITVDNAIVDFNTINNIVNTLNTHQDVFTAFEQETLLQATDTTTQSGVVSTPLNVTSVQMASVKSIGVIGPNTISFGVSFSAPPIVLVSIENTGSAPLVANITDSSSSSTTTSATSTYSGAIVNVAAANGGTPSGNIIIHLLAIGQR